jgi:DNA-binding GntR family transcriptional regulator
MEPNAQPRQARHEVRKDRLPSERKLQSDSVAARGTVRETLFQLEAKGLIYRRDRSGWYVSPPAVTYDPTRWYLTVARNRVDMCPCALVKEAADALGVKPRTPGLLVVRTSLAADGRVVEYDHEYWRHDAIRVHGPEGPDLTQTPVRPRRGRPPGAGGRRIRAGASGFEHLAGQG